MSSYGYAGYYKPTPPPRPRLSSLTAAAAGAPNPSDPFGLTAAGEHVGATPASRPLPQVVHRPNTTVSGMAPTVSRPPTQPQVQTPAGPPTPAAYDFNADPVYGQAESLIGMSNEQAQAEADKQRKQLLLAYGDPKLAQAVLGNDPTVQAAGQNPFSTLANLNTQHQRSTHDLTENLNKDNLLFSGYRVNQEAQAAQDYQSALAQAASGANQGLDSIGSQLAAALASGNQQQVAALMAAYQAHASDPGADPGAAGAGALGGGGSSGTVGAPAAGGESASGSNDLARVIGNAIAAPTPAPAGGSGELSPATLRLLIARAAGNATPGKVPF